MPETDGRGLLSRSPRKQQQCFLPFAMRYKPSWTNLGPMCRFQSKRSACGLESCHMPGCSWDSVGKCGSSVGVSVTGMA